MRKDNNFNDLAQNVFSNLDLDLKSLFRNNIDFDLKIQFFVFDMINIFEISARNR